MLELNFKPQTLPSTHLVPIDQAQRDPRNKHFMTNSTRIARTELANRLFFRLYQCANMLHKTGSRAVESDGLTTQQWAVLGALSRSEASDGVSIGELAKYLMVTRQNLTGVVSRMERDGHLKVTTDEKDRRSRLIQMTARGRQTWSKNALPKIEQYYEEALKEFSTSDMTHLLHYLLKLLDNMKQLDQGPEALEPSATLD
jgi:DNA-binding MarR family transcriptional regulator